MFFLRNRGLSGEPPLRGICRENGAPCAGGRKRMADVIPFRGILYNTSRITGGDVVAPPYDIITPELRDTLYRRSPYNIVRIDSGEEHEGDHEADNKYRRASQYLEQWQKEGLLTVSEKPCFYAYEMEYDAEGRRKKLSGFFGLVGLVELGKGVYPHEETHSKPKVDRLNLMIACNANTSPIFSLYHSPAKKASAIVKRVIMAKPYIEAQDTSCSIHRLWKIERDKDIAEITQDLKDKAIYIADGHHRYETALEYEEIREEQSRSTSGNEPYHYVLMFLANIAEGDITILPTHRVVKHGRGDAIAALSEHFTLTSLSPDDDIIKSMRGKTQTFGFFQKGDAKQYLLHYKGEGIKDIHPSLRGLDVTILHNLILKEILGVSQVRYEMDASIARSMVTDGDSDAVFFLNPTRVEDVERVALSTMRMPPKSTYFFPKVMTGFVINSFTISL
jgi:uncharacterized protein (DUF1015 family)